MYKKVSLLAFVVLMLLVLAPNTLAQPNKPDGFCAGGVGWPYVAGEDAQDPGCGAGRFIVHFDAGGYQGEEYAYNWPHAEWLLEGHARNGTYWFEPASWYAIDYVNAPVGFCNGGVPWNLGITHRPLNPYCGPGQYIIHYDAGGSQGENIQASWEGAELTRWGQQRTLWYEPSLTYQDAPAGFCNGGTPWNLPSNSIPNNPNCPVGRYLVDYDGFSDFRYDWGSAVSTLGYRAGTFWYEPESWYAGTPIPPTQAPLPACPAGYGSRTRILPGNYDPGVLTQDERQDLFELFGNSGTAPVGYGGQRCLGGHEIGQPKTYAPIDPTPVPPACPAGVGEPGSFDPASLTQQQRNELYWAFGHSGEAPVGYGGETCSGGTMTLPSFNSQPTSVPPTAVPPTPVPTQSGGGSNPDPTPNPIITVPLQYFGTTYNFQWNQETCEILNGSEIVAQETTRFWQVYESHSNDLAKINFAVQYFGVNDGGIEGFRLHIENNLHGEINGAPFSCTKTYKVGSHSMDTSGLGNIVFGYFARQYPVIFEDTVANIDQGVNQYSRWIFVDNPDDLTQRRTGGKVAELAGYQASVAPWTVEQAADQEGLW